MLKSMQLGVEVISTKISDSLNQYLTYSKKIELLRDRALNDPDEQLREWAQEQLEKLEIKNAKLKMEE